VDHVHEHLGHLARRIHRELVHCRHLVIHDEWRERLLTTVSYS
jgi:hypothetical protein